MHELSAPAWTADLLNAQQARRLAWLERLSALARFNLDSVTAFAWGFSFALDNAAEPFRTWLTRSTHVEHLFRLIARKLDFYGTYLVLTHDHDRGAICSWPDLPKAAEHLRCCVQSRKTLEVTSFIYSRQIMAALEIVEQPLNAQELPASCQTEWGTLLRLNPQKDEEALCYLSVDQPSDCSVPLVVNLSPAMVGIFGWSQSDVEPLRIALASPWASAIALHDIKRWLKSLAPRKKAAAGTKGNQ